MRWELHLRRWLVFLLCGLSGLPATAQRHGHKGSERSEILELEAKWRQAQLACDIPVMDKLLSDEFLGITAAGQVVTKNQQLDRMRSRRLALTRMDLSETKIKLSRNLAVVTSLAQLDGTAEGAPLRGAFRYTRVYQHIAGEGWKITNFEATRVGRPGGGALPGSAALPPATLAGPSAIVPSSLQASPAVPAFQQPRS